MADSESDEKFMRIMQQAFADMQINDYFIHQTIQYRPVLRFGEFVPIPISTFTAAQYHGIEINGDEKYDWFDVEFYDFDDALDYVNDKQAEKEEDNCICFDVEENVLEIDNLEQVTAVCEKLNNLLKNFDGLEGDFEL